MTLTRLTLGEPRLKGRPKGPPVTECIQPLPGADYQATEGPDGDLSWFELPGDFDPSVGSFAGNPDAPFFWPTVFLSAADGINDLVVDGSAIKWDLNFSLDQIQHYDARFPLFGAMDCGTEDYVTARVESGQLAEVSVTIRIRYNDDGDFWRPTMGVDARFLDSSFNNVSSFSDVEQRTYGDDSSPFEGTGGVTLDDTFTKTASAVAPAGTMWLWAWVELIDMRGTGSAFDSNPIGEAYLSNITVQVS